MTVYRKTFILLSVLLVLPVHVAQSGDLVKIIDITMDLYDRITQHQNQEREKYRPATPVAVTVEQQGAVKYTRVGLVDRFEYSPQVKLKFEVSFYNATAFDKSVHEIIYVYNDNERNMERYEQFVVPVIVLPPRKAWKVVFYGKGRMAPGHYTAYLGESMNTHQRPSFSFEIAGKKQPPVEYYK